MSADTISRTGVYHALKLDKDVHIPMRDGAYVVADVFRPETDGRFPIIMTMGPYSKDIHFRQWNPSLDYEHLPERGPYMHWETVNPDWWVPQGYVVIRVDGRGTGKSQTPPHQRHLNSPENSPSVPCNKAPSKTKGSTI